MSRSKFVFSTLSKLSSHLLISPFSPYYHHHRHLRLHLQLLSRVYNAKSQSESTLIHETKQYEGKKEQRSDSSIDCNSMSLNEVMMDNTKEMPSLLLKPGESMWRFKNYYEQMLRKKKFVKPHIDSRLDIKRNMWQCFMHIKQPVEMTFRGESNGKKRAESIAMAKALVWLRDNNHLNDEFMPIKSTSRERHDHLMKRKVPINVGKLDSSIRDKMNNFLDDFSVNSKKDIDLLLSRYWDNDIGYDGDLNGMAMIEGNEMLDDMIGSDKDCLTNSYPDKMVNQTQPQSMRVIRNVINDRPLIEGRLSDRLRRSYNLKSHLEAREQRVKDDPSYSSLRNKLEELPIIKFKSDILEAINGKSRVTVISGDTGCGKTTQVPQYILESYISSGKGCECNIVVTQPRRISAIAISERVAKEFGEEYTGNSIGYQVRFDKVLPRHDYGVILFCSAGILLRKFINNAQMQGVSHIVIDEVHERDVITDFLLVLLKRLIDTNPEIKVVLMSASMNANLFSEFFNHCPIIEIPGRCFPVTTYYLPQIKQLIESQVKFPVKEVMKIEPNVIAELVNYIARHKPKGAILCFLNGWKEIQEVSQKLEMLNSNDNPMIVLPLHSKLSHSMQQEIFKRPPDGVRKVVLATNIAETSLTIDDVVYVIDPGLCNEMQYDSIMNVSAFGTHWISRANARQRMGRAGRVQPGECYKIYSKQVETDQMKEYPDPEMLRIPLESAIIEIKAHFPYESAHEFLSEVPESPSIQAVASAIKTLKAIQVLTHDEKLTVLGKRILRFTTHPRMSVSLVYASMFGCVSPMLSLAAHSSASQSPFQTMPNDGATVRSILKEFSLSYLSEHIALAHLTAEYENISSYKSEVDFFCHTNNLNKLAMERVLETKRLFAHHLFDSFFIEEDDWNDTKSKANCNWHSKELLLAALICGSYPNVVRLCGGGIKNDKLVNNLTPIDINSGKRAKFTSQSLFHDSLKFSTEKTPEYVDALILYLSSFYSVEAKMLTIRDGSHVSPRSLMLFCGQELKLKKHMEKESIISVEDNQYLELNVNNDDAELLMAWKEAFSSLSKYFMLFEGVDPNVKNQKLEKSLKRFIDITKEFLESH